jgi:hypothetical protein
LPVPSDSTEDALVNTAGAAISVSTAKGLSDRGVIIACKYAAREAIVGRPAFA